MTGHRQPTESASWIAGSLLALTACGPLDGPSIKGIEEPLPTSAAVSQIQTILPNQGGPVIANPELVTITFADDPNRSNHEAYGAWIVGSNWLKVVGADYGVGAGTASSVRLTEVAPTTLTQANLESKLAQWFADGTIHYLNNAIYVIHLPQASSYTFSDSKKMRVYSSCLDADGVHDQLHTKGNEIPYAVIFSCFPSNTVVPADQDNDANPLTGLDVHDRTTSHEFIEAATDPFGMTHPAWKFAPSITADTSAWSIFGSESADLCTMPHVSIREAGYIVQRIWSNSSAARGEDPCVPVDPSNPYFGFSGPKNWLQVKPGQNIQIVLTGWSTAPVHDWGVSEQGNDTMGIFNTFTTTPEIMLLNINNGVTSTLNITVPTDAPRGAYSSIWFVSYLPTTDPIRWVTHTTPIGFFVR